MPPDEDDSRLDRFLRRLVPGLAQGSIERMLRNGLIRVDGGKARANSRLLAGQIVRLPPDLQPVVEKKSPGSPKIVASSCLRQQFDDMFLAEGRGWLAINKPSGLAVQGGTSIATHLDGMLRALASRSDSRLRLVHRIDKDTSGLLVVAKTDRAHEGLAVQFKDHSIDRLYAAIVYGHPVPPTATVDTWIGRSDADRKKMAVHREGRGKHAVTHYRMEERLTGAAMVECRLETGRTHQVRVHMAHIGHPLIGDPVYSRDRKGFKSILETLGFKRQALHAKTLGFIHPATGLPLLFQSALPMDMQELLSELRV